MRRTVLLATAIVVVAAGCSDDERGPNISGLDDYSISSVVVQPSIDTIFLAESPASTPPLLFTATAFSRLNTPLGDMRFVWRSSDVSVATVDTGGLVTPVGVGTAEITASAGKIGKATVVVVPEERAVIVTAAVTQLLVGDTVQLSAQALGFDDLPLTRTITWTSSAPNVATIDQTGRVIFVGVGSATFTASTRYRSGSITLTALSRNLLSIDAGGDVTCGTTALGRGYCWGNGQGGLLASTADSSCFNDTGAGGSNAPCTLEPKRFAGPAIAFRTVAAGETLGCGVSMADRLFCWGSDEEGQIGNGGLGAGEGPAAVSVASEAFASVTAGDFHACALTTNGSAFCWGRDNVGQLGDRRRVNSSTPIPVVGTTGRPEDALRYSRISAGTAHTCAIQQGGATYCWGNGSTGTLGHGARDTVDVPVRVLGGGLFTEIAAGFDHSCGVAVGGELYCWGKNVRGQLGTSTVDTVQVTPVLVGSGYVNVSAGRQYTCALTSAGEVRCFGDNRYGQLGRGEGNPTGSSQTPTSVTGALRFASISAGRRHACGMGTDGEAYCWGSNMLGALGNQLQAAHRSSPVRVARPR